MSEQYKIRGWVRILLMLIPYLFVVGVFQMIGAALVDYDYGNIGTDKNSQQRFIIQLFTFLGTCLIVGIFVKYIDKEQIISIGLKIKNRSSDLWIGFTIGTIIMIFAFGILEFLNEIQFQKIVFDLNEIILSVFLFIFVSLTEEILFRGYILRNLMYSFNKYVALLISALIFAVAHGMNPNIDIIGLTNIFLGGILLGITYIHTKNLWFPIALHFSWNFFQVLLGFNVSGQNVYSLVRFKMPEETLLNGGAFGFEGSILSLIILLISIISITIYYRKKPIATPIHHK
ncbi:CPBP family intramembrane glutamic endopeptidase [Christiangramia echinicola]|uniref:CAAX prenyl protease 2/Lysostaphin resistance protein A-like domain-containing protein n=1 Tax=Christiangramia echinicola TaxID=279359 RepID=A0A1H1M3R0_9FLAO|nr:CPBP family intramembrane glutamic endopeptidase [Christiangramia echinicola]SDR81132.1 hypothetical protein SAMN04488552_1130 [Christiangramia echinicola]